MDDRIWTSQPRPDLKNCAIGGRYLGLNVSGWTRAVHYFSQCQITILCCVDVNSPECLQWPGLCFLHGSCSVLPKKQIKWHIPLSQGALFLESGPVAVSLTLKNTEQTHMPSEAIIHKYKDMKNPSIQNLHKTYTQSHMQSDECTHPHMPTWIRSHTSAASELFPKALTRQANPSQAKVRQTRLSRVTNPSQLSPFTDTSSQALTPYVRIESHWKFISCVVNLTM